MCIFTGKLKRSVSDIETDFKDGVNFLLLMGMLGGNSNESVLTAATLIKLFPGYFLTLDSYFYSPSSPDQSLHNLRLFESLLSDEDVSVRGSIREVQLGHVPATLRILYHLYIKFASK